MRVHDSGRPELRVGLRPGGGLLVFGSRLEVRMLWPNVSVYLLRRGLGVHMLRKHEHLLLQEGRSFYLQQGFLNRLHRA